MKYLFILLALIAVSCNQESPQSKEVTTMPAEDFADVSALREAFLAGWNSHDSSAIRATISDNAIAMNDSLIYEGAEEIADYWISSGIKVLSNIQTTSLISEAGTDIAYDGGTYTLDLTPPGGKKLKEEGNYSLIWNKQIDGKWRLALIHIEDVTRLPDVK
jgi:ketosteroid isomerase-like protein